MSLGDIVIVVLCILGAVASGIVLHLQGMGLVPATFRTRLATFLVLAHCVLHVLSAFSHTVTIQSRLDDAAGIAIGIAILIVLVPSARNAIRSQESVTTLRHPQATH